MVPPIRRKKKKSQKIRKRTKKYSLASILDRNKALLSIIGIIGSGIAVILLLIIVLQQTILSEKYEIQNIVYAEASITVYDHPQIYKDINDYLIDRNYFITKRFGKNELHEYIITRHPIVKSIALAQQDDNIIFVEIAFEQPNIVFFTPTQRFALYQQQFYDLTSGNSLGNQATNILLPGYTSGYQDLNGILYQIDEEQLTRQIQNIQDTLGGQYISSFNYLPGGSKLIVIYKAKTVYFHLDKDINIQLNKLLDIEDNFDGFSALTVIDAGSVDDIIAR